MKFSVLMSVYNGDSPEFLEEALESIYNQTLLPDELVLVIDGPINLSLQHIIKGFIHKEKPVLRQIPLKQNIGLGPALAKGLTLCKNDIIARMDSDDICKKHRFEIQIKFLEENPQVGIIGSWIDEFIDVKTNVISKRKVPEKHEDLMRYIKGRCPFNHPTVVFRKNEILSVGNYKPFYLKEDIYLWLRLAKAGVEFRNIPESLLFFRTTKEMFKRRGGWKYAKSELDILIYRYRIGVISYMEFIYYCILTLPVRLSPNWVRGFIYTKLLR